MTSAKKKQRNHENAPFSQRKAMWKAQQAKEKSGAARKRGAYIFFCAAARRIALQGLPNPAEKPDFKENVENLNTLRNDSFALVLTVFLYTGIFEAISGEFEHYSTKAKCIRKTFERK